MLKYLYKLPAVFFILLLNKTVAQDKAVILRDAKNLEQKFDEPSALDKYKLLVAEDPENVVVLVKCTELYCSIGERQKDKKIKAAYYDFCGYICF